MKDPVKIPKTWILLSVFALLSSNLNFPVDCHIQRQRQLILKLDDADNTNHNLLQRLMLTPLIKSGRVADARRASQVTDLNLTQNAGQGQIQSQQLAIVSHSGFLSVSPDNHLFFWFFPNRDPTVPLLLWLQGGPGESSMYGLFTEHGPFKLVNNTKDDSIDLRLRENPWTQTHSIIYMDSPVGTGFSFTENPKGYAKNQDDVARDLYEALLQFFQLFPEQKSVDFYATGESYGGKYVPAITRKIHLENRILANLAVPSPSFINLKGMAIGNPLSDPISTFNYGDFLYNIGLIGKKGRKIFQIEEQKAINLITEEKFFDAFKVIEKLLFGYKSNVTNEIIPSIFLEQTGLRTMYNYLTDEDSPDQYLFIKFLQQESVRRAIHAGNGTFSHADADGLVGENLAGDIFKSVLGWYDEILDAPENYRVMVYTGQVDILCNEPGASDFIAKLNWTRAAEFQEAEREVWWINQDDKINVAGYAQEAGGFTQVLVRNAGHRVPWDQPTYAFDMINRFTRGKSFVTVR